jgi:hypothetical protein
MDMSQLHSVHGATGVSLPSFSSQLHYTQQLAQLQSMHPGGLDSEVSQIEQHLVSLNQQMMNQPLGQTQQLVNQSQLSQQHLLNQQLLSHQQQLIGSQQQLGSPSISQGISDLPLGIEMDSQMSTPLKSHRKHEKDAQMNVCLALGCERQIKQRRLCSMHQKQKERNGGKLELKENVKFAKGRTPTPFSKHANKYAKLKSFDKKVDEWAGGREEGTMMLESYMESSYHQARFPKHEDSKIYEQIGKNIVEFMKHLPEKSPLRRPLIKAMSENVALARLREVLPVSKQTVINSKKLADQDNLLLTIKYKPNVTRSRKRDGSLIGDIGEEVSIGIGGMDNPSPEEIAFSSHHPHLGGHGGILASSSMNMNNLTNSNDMPPHHSMGIIGSMGTAMNPIPGMSSMQHLNAINMNQ